MNYLIVDTEKTYNVGIVVFNESGIVLKKQFVVKENFENRAICGENNYNRKKKIFDDDKDVVFNNGVFITKELSNIIRNYDIKGIFAHNSAEDRIQLGQLYSQYSAITKLENPFIKIYDTIKIVKKLYPSNTDNSLQFVINDILGVSLPQLHTALDDAIWLAGILIPIYKYLYLFVNYEEIFIGDKPMMDAIYSISKCKSFTVDKDIFETIQKPDYTIKTFNARLKQLQELQIVSSMEKDRIGKNGNVLKTKDTAYIINKNFEYILQDIITFNSLKFDFIKDFLATLLVPYLSTENKVELEVFEKSLKEKYNSLEKELIEKNKISEKNLIEKYNSLEKELVDKTNKNLYLKKNELEKSFNLLTKDYSNSAVKFLDNYNNKQNKKIIKQLEKKLKKNEISKEDFVIEILKL